MEDDEAHHSEQPHDVLELNTVGWTNALQHRYVVALCAVALDDQRVEAGVVRVEATGQVGMRRTQWTAGEVLVVGAAEQLGQTMIAFVLRVTAGKRTNKGLLG